MNLKQIAVAGLACCAIAVSCQGNDKKISYEDAEKYVEEHCTLKEIPTPKSGKIEWNFNDTDKTQAETAFNQMINNCLKKSQDYSKSGNGELDFTKYKIYTLLNKDELKKYKDYDLFQNSTGIKVVGEETQSNMKYKYQIQFDDKGRTSMQEINIAGETNTSNAKINTWLKYTYTY